MDLMQIAWTFDLQERFYSSGLVEALDDFNEKAQRFKTYHPSVLTCDDLPNMSMRYPEYKHMAQSDFLNLLGVPVRKAPSNIHTKCPVETANTDGVGSLSIEELRADATMSCGHRASDEEVEEYRRSRMGGSYLWDVTGDLFDFATFESHMHASIVGRGNAYKKDDPAVVLLQDCETLFTVRMIERNEEETRLRRRATVGSMGLTMGEYKSLDNMAKNQQIQDDHDSRGYQPKSSRLATMVLGESATAAKRRKVAQEKVQNRENLRSWTGPALDDDEDEDEDGDGFAPGTEIARGSSRWQ
jgi:hypothetical protein